MMKHFICSVFLTVCLVVGFGGCSGSDINENNPEELYKDAEEDIKASRNLVALEKLKTIKNKFPYSTFSTKAALRIADVHFKEEQFTEAVAAYEGFRDLHPKYEKADYVIFMIGESYFMQMPKTVDRDQTPGLKAIDAYVELGKLYPQSEHTDKAREHQKEALEKLAGKEKYIADFYFTRDQFDSAARRYEKITTLYPGTSIEQNAYWGWGDSLFRQALVTDKQDERTKFVEQYTHVFKVYLAKFPNGSYATRAEKILKGAEGSDKVELRN